MSRPVMAGMAALTACGWWFINLQPFSGGALVALFGAAAGLIALSSAHRRRTWRGHRGRAVARGDARVLVLAGRVWVGWHFFVRTTR